MLSTPKWCLRTASACERLHLRTAQVNQPIGWQIYPGTEAAVTARKRIAHLDGTNKASSVKAALQRIVDRYPGTELALAARERIAQLEQAERNFLATPCCEPLAGPEGFSSASNR